MKKPLVLLFIFFSFVSSIAQKSPILFQKTVHDFGNVPELVEDIEYRFLFKNMGDSLLSIKEVKADCDCTKPTFYDKKIKKSGKGFIKVGFQRYNRAGAFEKKLTVIALSDTIEIKTELTIKGNVIAKEKFDVKRYKHQMGRVAVITPNIMMGDILTNEVKTKEFFIYNNSDTLVKLKSDNLPDFLEVNILPKEVPAKSFATVEIKYNPIIKKDFGFLVDTLVIISKKEDQKNENTFILRSTIHQHFGSITENQVTPKIALSTYTHDLGFITKNGKKQGTFEIDNIGDVDLTIHTVKSFCSCITILDNKSYKIPREETIQITYEMNTKGYNEGKKMKKTIVVYSNDPIHPEKKLIVKALVK